MEITQVSASIRMSRQIDGGTWATVELGAEASVTDPGSWTGDQAQLYNQLRDQLKLLWKEHAGEAQANGRAVNTATGEVLDRPAGPLCPQHGQAKESEKFDGLYCPVKLDDGKWYKWKTQPDGSRRKLRPKGRWPPRPVAAAPLFAAQSKTISGRNAFALFPGSPSAAFRAPAPGIPQRPLRNSVTRSPA